MITNKDLIEALYRVSKRTKTSEMEIQFAHYNNDMCDYYEDINGEIRIETHEKENVIVIIPTHNR
jgi:hypothetical protein